MERKWEHRQQPSQPNSINHQDVQYSDTTCSIFYFRHHLEGIEVIVILCFVVECVCVYIGECVCDLRRSSSGGNVLGCLSFVNHSVTISLEVWLFLFLSSSQPRHSFKHCFTQPTTQANIMQVMALVVLMKLPLWKLYLFLLLAQDSHTTYLGVGGVADEMNDFYCRTNNNCSWDLLWQIQVSLHSTQHKLCKIKDSTIFLPHGWTNAQRCHWWPKDLKMTQLL